MPSETVLLTGVDVRVSARHCALEAQRKYRASRSSRATQGLTHELAVHGYLPEQGGDGSGPVEPLG